MLITQKATGLQLEIDGDGKSKAPLETFLSAFVLKELRNGVKGKSFNRRHA